MIKKIWTYFKVIFLIALIVFLYGFASSRNEYKKVTGILIEFESGENLYMNRKMVNKLLIQNSKTAAKAGIQPYKQHAKRTISRLCTATRGLFNQLDSRLRGNDAVFGRGIIWVKQTTPYDYFILKKK